MNENRFNNQQRQILLSLIIFCLIIFVIPWAFWFYYQYNQTEIIRNLAMLIWILTPLAGALIARIKLKNGWKDMGFGLKQKDNISWYLAAIFIYPIVIGLVLLSGKVTGSSAYLAFFSDNRFWMLFLTGFISNFLKNIFEESGWRGYLTPKLFSLNLNQWSTHLIIGLIWGLWHLPYYLGFLKADVISSFTSMDIALFIPMVIAGITVSSIAFNELRLLTGSIWPAVIMHTMHNSIMAAFVIGQFINVDKSSQIIFSPNMEGVLSMLLILVVGIILNRIRNRK